MPPSLDTSPRFDDPGRPSRYPQQFGDDFYAALVQAHEGLSDDHSALLNARLVLLLANQVGDLATLREALAAARSGLGPGDPALPLTP
jgi:hypothetical protein